MTFKQFLKPDYRKAVITLVFFSIFLLFYNVPVICLLLCYLGGAAYGCRCVNPYYPIEYAFLSFIIFYLLSCLIIWIYDKLKKKS